MFEGIVISSVGALVAASQLLFKKEVRKAKHLSLKVEISSSNSHTRLEHFLGESQNKVACKRFYYEVPIITLLFRLSMLLCILSYVISIALLFKDNLGVVASSSSVLEKSLHVCVVVSCFSAFGCAFIAGTHNE